MKRTPKGASAPAAKPILKLVSPPISRSIRSKPVGADLSDESKECIEYLRSLLECAERGEIIGIICAAVKAEDGYSTAAVGLAWNSRTFAIGMAEVLKTRLVNRALS